MRSAVCTSCVCSGRSVRSTTTRLITDIIIIFVSLQAKIIPLVTRNKQHTAYVVKHMNAVMLSAAKIQAAAAAAAYPHLT